MTAVQDELFAPQTPAAFPSEVLSWGLGVDSTAILLRWLYEPTTREFGLDKLVVVVAHTGDEYAATLRDAQDVVLPLLARYGVRLVQAGRIRLNTTAAGAGVSIFNDSTRPTRLYADQGYTLSDELLAAGTVPQLGSRRCSLRAKGAVLDPIIAALTAGSRFGTISASKPENRAERSATRPTTPIPRAGSTPCSTGSGRAPTPSIEYLVRVTGRFWHKSACSYCLFSFSSKPGRSDALERYCRDPDAGVQALYLEYVAACLNPRQSLLAQGRLIASSLTLDSPRSCTGSPVIWPQQHALYEVRRVATPRRAATPAIARSVRRLDAGSAAASHARLMRLPAEIETSPDGISRGWRRRRDTAAPWAEHFYVVAPSATIADKQRRGFEAMYAQATGAVPALVA